MSHIATNSLILINVHNCILPPCQDESTRLLLISLLFVIISGHLELLSVISGHVSDTHYPVLDQPMVVVTHRRSHASAIVMPAHDYMLHLFDPNAEGTYAHIVHSVVVGSIEHPSSPREAGALLP